MFRHFIIVASLLVTSLTWANPEEQEADENLQQEMQEAQQALQEATRKIAELSRQLARDEAVTWVQGDWSPKRRAMLGVTVDDADKDLSGVLITGVSPGGPASEAGIEAGDLITSINGVELPSSDEKSMHKMLEVLEVMEPGDVAELRILRDGKNRTINVTTQDFSKVMPKLKEQFSFDYPFENRTFEKAMEELEARMEDLGENGLELEMHDFETLTGKLEATIGKLGESSSIAMFGIPLGIVPDLSVTSINAEVGAYFGVEQGLLITKTPLDVEGLKGGDVIVAIDGDPVSKYSDMFEKFAITNAGDKLAFEIVRQKESLSVDVEVPKSVMSDKWHCERSDDGSASKCVGKDGKNFRFRFSTDD